VVKVSTVNADEIASESSYLKSCFDEDDIMGGSDGCSLGLLKLKPPGILSEVDDP